jgi:L-idonate 5-dehydrogenase
MLAILTEELQERRSWFQVQGQLDRALAVGATRVIQIGLEELPPNEFDLVFECSAAASAVSAALVAEQLARLTRREALINTVS